MNLKKIIQWAALFLIFFTAMQLLNKKKQDPAPPGTASAVGTLTIKTSDDEYPDGKEVIARIKNNTDKTITLPLHCPNNPLTVLTWTGEKFEEKNAVTKINCELAPAIALQPQKETSVSFAYWNYALFGEPGRYKIALTLEENGKKETVASDEFQIVQAGVLRKAGRTFFYTPLYNILVAFLKFGPGQSLGFAIIMLTLVVRLILLVPSQRAMVSQRRMQELQPKLEHIKKKYAGNKEQVAMETMKLWKEHKVNPMGSCLPLIIQFPVLIALFYVIKDGLNPDNAHLIYEPLKNIDLSVIGTNFLGLLELTKVNIIALPLIIGAMQFIQLKLAGLKKKNAGEHSAHTEMESANKMMIYVMPVMIAFFTASVPAGVGLYWGVSTLFAIGQQLIVNRKI